MKALVLLSQGRHPVSGIAHLPRTEAQAIRLAAGLDPAVEGVHAGPCADAVREALGRGLRRLTHVRLAADADPLDALATAIRRAGPDVVLAGPRGEGGADTGLVPYALAAALAWPVIADAIALEAGAAARSLCVVQALPGGARKRILVRLPAVVTVHAAAPEPLPFAYGRARSGGFTTTTDSAAAAAAEPDRAGSAIAERPYRRRPKVLAQAAGQPAATAARIMINPDPGDAARAILAFLRTTGVFKGRG